MTTPRTLATVAAIAGALLAIAVPAPARAQISIGQLDQIDASGACRIRPTIGATIYAAIRRGGLADAAVLQHAASRLGYGLAPIGPLVARAANDCTTVFVADEIERQIGSLGAVADTPQLTRVRRALFPLTMFTRAELNAALARLTPSGVSGTLGYDARRSLASLKTLRELVGSQRVHNGTLVDVQINLDEVLTELWLAHFNVEVEKGWYYVNGSDGYPEVVRRAHGGTFAGLLGAVMRQPGMLVYLDNNANRCDPATGAASNQNLGRELLELHTLGVGPGAGIYDQEDVEAAASILCGWNALAYTTAQPAGSSGFVFNAMLASTRAITALGTTYPASGAARVDAFLDALAGHPATRTAICGKLASRFYAPGLRGAAAAACASAWGVAGPLQPVVRALIERDAFWKPANTRALQRTPIELVVGVARRIGLRVTDLTAAVAGMDEQPFRPATLTAPSVTANLATLHGALPHRAIAMVMAQIQNLLGSPRMSVAPPSGYPLDGAAFMSPSYVDDASRLGLEVAAAFNRITTRNDLSSSATRSALDAKLATTSPGAALAWFVELRMALGPVISGPAASASHVIAPAHVANATDVLADRATWASHASAPTAGRSSDTVLGLVLGSVYELWR